MRYDSDLHEPRTNAEQSETADDLRVSYESQNDRRLPYHEDQLRRRADYSGFVDVWTDDEMRSILRELLQALACDEHDYPLPPTGLPGFLNTRYDQDEPAAELLQLGMDYLLAVLRNERRTMHFRWREARELIRKIKQSAGTIDQERIVSAEAAWAEDRFHALTNPVPQLVYFIGAESGPIKIGIATKPDERLKGLQTGHHEKLELLATCEGGQPQERSYHAQFAALRLSGEWFERSPEIEAEIARLHSVTQELNQ